MPVMEDLQQLIARVCSDRVAFRRLSDDSGVLVELAHTGLENTRTRWNSVSHTDEEDVLWSTSPYVGWSPSWEDFSRGSEWFFATGFEASSSIAVYKRVSLLSSLMLLRKFTYTEKVYGDSEIPEGQNSFTFTQSQVRNNYRNETWMTGAIGLSYGRGPVQTFLTLQLPTAYLIKQRTKLADNSELLFEHQKHDVWQVQTPTTFRVLLVFFIFWRVDGDFYRAIILF